MRELFESQGFVFIQSNVIEFQWHCVDLRITIAKQGSNPRPWVAWEIVPARGVDFIKDPTTGEVATFETAFNAMEAAIARKTNKT